MSKLVVKIKDDDKTFPHCPLHHEGYCHLPQLYYQKDNALYMTPCLGMIDKRPPWCPLKEEKEAIPMWFLEKWFGTNYQALTDLQMEWKKECKNEIYYDTKAMDPEIHG